MIRGLSELVLARSPIPPLKLKPICSFILGSQHLLDHKLLKFCRKLFDLRKVLMHSVYFGFILTLNMYYYHVGVAPHFYILLSQFLVIANPANTASYSTSLLVVLNPILMAYPSFALLGV
jgi:hypothetical protein